MIGYNYMGKIIDYRKIYVYIYIVCAVCVCASWKRDMAESAMEGSLRESWPKASNERKRGRELEGRDE